MKTLKRVFLICGTLPFMLSCTDSVIDSYIESVGGNVEGGTSTDGVRTLETYDWPTEEGQAKISEHYKIYVSLDGEEETEIEVLQSDPIVEKLLVNGNYDEDYHASYTKQRTFSFVPISYDDSKGKKLNIRVESLDGFTNPVLSPKSYNITPNASGSSISFSVDKSSRYICVNFDCQQNIVNHPQAHDGWIKHMLMIYVDPAETLKPNPSRQKIVYYSDDLQDADIANAQVLYFKPGYYNLKNFKNKGNTINEHGGLTLTSNQQLYIAGGAFVEGYILRKNFSDENQMYYGRGILSGRQYVWQPDDPNRLMGQLVMGARYSTFDGIIVMESPNHGIVTTDECVFRNVKFLGWHCNNDGFRPGNNSKISNCFLRACDDFFYNYSLEVKDCVLWPCFNGSIMTNGWAAIDIGGSLMENIDIIYTEWTGFGANKGLIMSQNNYEYNPPLGSQTTVFRNIRIEGYVPGFVNLKAQNGVPQLEDASLLGWMGNILLENISIDEHADEPNNLIKGGKPAVVGDPNSIWWIKDVTLRNVTIGGVKVTDENKSKWFTIDKNTTQNIVFE